MKATSFHSAAMVATLAVPALPQVAQDYPDRKVQGIIQWRAGGATDTVALAMQPKAEHLPGQRPVMVNRSGGSGAPGMRFVQSLSDDGQPGGPAAGKMDR